MNWPLLHARWVVAPSAGAHVLLACHVVMYDVKKTTCKFHVNGMMFVLLPVTSG